VNIESEPEAEGGPGLEEKEKSQVAWHGHWSDDEAERTSCGSRSSEDLVVHMTRPRSVAGCDDFVEHADWCVREDNRSSRLPRPALGSLLERLDTSDEKRAPALQPCPALPCSPVQQQEKTQATMTCSIRFDDRVEDAKKNRCKSSARVVVRRVAQPT